MVSALSLVEIIIYVIIWAAIGGLPGFYLFTAIDRNPRSGARLGVVVGVVIGIAGGLGPIDDIDALVNAALFLWTAALIAAVVLSVGQIGIGNHSQTASIGQKVADLAYGLLLPTFILVFAIVVFPMIWNFVLAFRPVRLRDLQGLTLFSLEDATFENFSRVFAARGFSSTLIRTFTYTLSGTSLAIFIGLVAALVVKDHFRGRNVVRGFILFPYIAPIVAVVLIWKLMLNAQFGLINEINADVLGGRRIAYLSTPGTAFITVVLFQAWRYFPFAFLFILARIQAIPEDMYEAAKVDGAVPSQRLWYITLPQLRAVFGTLFLLRFIWTFNKFDDVFLLTGGAANTRLITIEIFDQIFSRRNIGSASAVAVIQAAVLFVVVGIYFKWFLAEEN